MRVPVVLLSGIDPDAMAGAMVGLQFDLPSAVAVRHAIDVERGVLTRTVSDLGGVIETHELLLEHACVSCAIREDVLPTLERLARDGRWSTIVAHLPVGAEAAHLCAVLTWDTRLARFLRVSSVITAVSADTVLHDLIGDDLLADRGRHTAPDDRRGTGEVLAAMVEYADVVTVDGPVDEAARGLLRALARPGVDVVEGGHGLDPNALTGRLHQHVATEAWTSPTRDQALPTLDADRPGGDPAGAWRLDLRSELPFHPDRLLDSLESLGGGDHRSRGCFWLPTRPGRALEWDGAGGQLSIGDHRPWGRQRPFTRIVLTGVGTPPDHLRGAFEHLLATEQEIRGIDAPWNVVEDGFEPWLGPIREVA